MAKTQKYVVDKVRSLWCVYDNHTGSKISGHITFKEAKEKADELNKEKGG